jgi:hypothetical protein
MSQPLGIIDPRRSGESSIVASSAADTATPKMPLMVPLGLAGEGVGSDGTTSSKQTQQDEVMLLFRQHEGDPWSAPVRVSSVLNGRVLVEVPGSNGSRPLFCWLQAHAVQLIATSSHGVSGNEKSGLGSGDSRGKGMASEAGEGGLGSVPAWKVLEIWPTAFFVNDAPWPMFCRIRPGRSGEEEEEQQQTATHENRGRVGYKKVCVHVKHAGVDIK